MGINQEVKIEKSQDVNIIKKLFPYLKKQLPIFILSLLFIGITTAIDLLIPYLTKVAIDDSIALGNVVLLKKISMIMVGLFLINFVFNFANVYLLNFAAQKIVYSLRSDLYKHILKLSLSFFDRNPVGRLVTRVTSDMDNISKLFTDVLVTVIKDFSLIIGAVVVMLSLNWKLALIAMATLPIVIAISFLFRFFARKIQRDVKVKLAKINASLAESVNGMKIVQIFNRENLTKKEFDEQNRDYLKSSLDETKVYALFRPGIHLMSGISLGLILIAGGFTSLDGSLEIGVLVAFFQYINHLFRPISNLAEKFNIFQSSMASSERVFILLEEGIDIKNSENPKIFTEKNGSITLENVNFSYIEGTPVLKNINLDIKPGETVALVGATGSGKTTITSIMSRLYDIDSGSIKIDGIDIRDLDKNSLRKRISIVLQDVFLFSGDIKGNINLNNDNISLNKVIEASKFVNAHRFISKLPGEYNHEVRERGSTFSAGEKQLISFARALAFDPDILILDEATSSIDTETESLIQDAIEKLIKDRTTIIVAHRLSTIKHADKIVVLHKGEIKEIGKHDDLLKKGGMYYDLYKLQVEAH